MNCQACGHENVDEARFCASCGAALPTRVESQHDPLIGQVIGNRYRITGIIGEGGMGVVYVGEQQMGSTIRKVAVKTLHPHLSKDASVLKRFHRECGTVAQLEHPNTIKVYDFGFNARRHSVHCDGVRCRSCFERRAAKGRKVVSRIASSRYYDKSAAP